MVPLAVGVSKRRRGAVVQRKRRDTEGLKLLLKCCFLEGGRKGVGRSIFKTLVSLKNLKLKKYCSTAICVDVH